MNQTYKTIETRIDGRVAVLSRNRPAVLNGHQGLLGASMTGQVTAEVISGRPPSIDLAQFSIARFT